MLNFFNGALIFLCAYCVGAFPTGYFLTLFFFNTDLRTVGSKTVGASNAARVLGLVGFLSVFLLDAGKAYACLLGYSTFFSQCIISIPVFWLGILIVLGNIFSFGSSYPRGKGVATALGVLLFFDMWLFFVFIPIWLIIVLLCRIPTYASLIGAFILSVVAFATDVDSGTRFFLIALHPILFYTHRIAIQQLLSDERVLCYLRQLRRLLPALKR
jgi:glycerol-3-phosphate acyltransferase PlsY